jgi:hypothetical protein
MSIGSGRTKTFGVFRYWLYPDISRGRTAVSVLALKAGFGAIPRTSPAANGQVEGLPLRAPSGLDFSGQSGDALWSGLHPSS